MLRWGQELTGRGEGTGAGGRSKKQEKSVGKVHFRISILDGFVLFFWRDCEKIILCDRYVKKMRWLFIHIHGRSESSLGPEWVVIGATGKYIILITFIPLSKIYNSLRSKTMWITFQMLVKKLRFIIASF